MKGKNFTKHLNVILFIVLAFFVASFTANSGTIIVTNDGDYIPGKMKAPPGTCLRDAIMKALPGDVITFAPNAGTVFTISGTLLITTSPVTIDGNKDGAGNITIQVPNQSTSTFRVFRVNTSGAAGTVTIQNMTVKGGNVSAGASGGGSIYNDNATLALNNVTVSGSTAAGGGGVFNHSNTGKATITLNNCTITGCHSVTVGGNGDGGGIQNNGGDMTLTNCTISSNDSDTTGGGIAISGGAVNTITGCTISSNTVTGTAATNAGGGIAVSESTSATVQSATANITNSTISGNTAYNGGGIFEYAANSGNTTALTINSCTITNNTASTVTTPIGGLVPVRVGGTCNLTISNTILAGNVDGSSNPADYGTSGTIGFTDNGYNVIGSTQNWTGTGDWNGTNFSANFTQVGSGTSASMSLGALAVNAPGSTATHSVTDGNTVAYSITSASSWNGTPSTDQRGQNRTTTGTYRAIGSYDNSNP